MKNFELAAIFSEEEVRNDFIDCIASIMHICNSVTILVEGQNGVTRIAEMSPTYESKNLVLRLQMYKDIAEQYGINVEATESLLNVAAIINGSASILITKSIKLAMAITENYNISHK